MNSTFRAHSLASSEVISQVLFTSEQRKENKMSSRFTSVSEEEILSMNEALPENIKMARKFGATVFDGKLFNLSKVKNQNTTLFSKTVEH